MATLDGSLLPWMDSAALSPPPWPVPDPNPCLPLPLGSCRGLRLEDFSFSSTKLYLAFGYGRPLSLGTMASAMETRETMVWSMDPANLFGGN